MGGLADWREHHVVGDSREEMVQSSRKCSAGGPGDPSDQSWSWRSESHLHRKQHWTCENGRALCRGRKRKVSDGLREHFILADKQIERWPILLPYLKLLVKYVLRTSGEKTSDILEDTRINMGFLPWVACYQVHLYVPLLHLHYCSPMRWHLHCLQNANND